MSDKSICQETAERAFEASQAKSHHDQLLLNAWLEAEQTCFQVMSDGKRTPDWGSDYQMAALMRDHRKTKAKVDSD